MWLSPSRQRKFCSEKCREKKYTPERAQQVFWSRVDKTGDCWLYMAARDKWGYGELQYLGKHLQAHRLSWMILKGHPGKMHVLHKCNNPPCCNPDHLYLGTDKENARDRMAAGRYVVGEKMHMAKLTEEQAREVRRLYKKRAPGNRGNSRELAARYGVSQNYIANLVSGRTWKHL